MHYIVAGTEGAGEQSPTPQISANKLTLFKSGGADYAHNTTARLTGFSDLPTALFCKYQSTYPPQVMCRQLTESFSCRALINVLSDLALPKTAYFVKLQGNKEAGLKKAFRISL